jgi:hypothetical protein
MNANIDLKLLPEYFKQLALKAKRFLVPAFIVLVIVVNGFLVYKINHFSSQEPTMEQVSSQKNTIKSINIDQQTIDKILSLQKRNIKVKALFKDARDNPFKAD